MSLLPPPNEIAEPLLEFAAIPQPVRLIVAEPCTEISFPVLPSARSQVKPARLTLATARAPIVTLGRKSWAKRVCCCLAKTTSTHLSSVHVVLATGGLLAHI